MQFALNSIASLNLSGLNIFLVASSLIIALCTTLILLSVLISFLLFDKAQAPVVKKSKVDTFTMLLFFVAFYFVVRFRVGQINLPTALQLGLLGVGLIVIVLGTIVNIVGRFNLSTNWANHIKIYSSHTFVQSGMYRLVRHPLYASLIWMFFAASLVYANWLGALLTAAIFVPMMYYRARQEEELLQRRFKQYAAYKQKVKMFVPW